MTGWWRGPGIRPWPMRDRGSGDQAVAFVRLADDADDFVGLVGQLEQGELAGADVGPGEHRVLEPGQQAGPVGPADQHDRELGDLAGSDQGQRLEQLVHGAEPAGQHHERLGVLDEAGLPHEEVAELQAYVDEVVEAHLPGQFDAQAHRDAAGLGGALVGGLHDPGAAAGDHGVAGLGQAGGDALGGLVLGTAARGPRRAEDRDRGPELGQQAEPLHELGLDPQHAPGVGVHPVGRPPPVEQPLIGGGGWYLLVAQRDGSLATDPPVRLGISVHDVTKVVARKRCRWPRAGRWPRTDPGSGGAGVTVASIPCRTIPLGSGPGSSSGARSCWSSRSRSTLFTTRRRAAPPPRRPPAARRAPATRPSRWTPTRPLSRPPSPASRPGGTCRGRRSPSPSPPRCRSRSCTTWPTATATRSGSSSSAPRKAGARPPTWKTPSTPPPSSSPP